MKKRGKVVRDTSVGTGLLVAGGKQYPFELEGMWQSETAPRVNMVVDVELDEAGQVLTVVVIPETQLAREQAEVAMQVAREKSARLGKEAIARFGVGTVCGMAALVLGWFMFNVVTVNISAGHSEGMTLWTILGALNSPSNFMNALSGNGSGTGVYGFLAMVCLVGPLLPFFVKHRLASLGGLLPLLFMVLVCFKIYSGINDSLTQANSAAAFFGGAQAAQYASAMMSQMAKEALRALSVGLGGYLAFGAALFFAVRSVIKFLSSRA